MSSFNRRLFLISTVALAGCGFAPVYGPNSASGSLRNAVAIAPPNTRDDYGYARAMEQALGRVGTAQYALDYTINTSEDPVGLTRDQEINRYHIVGGVTYNLTEIATGQTLASGTVNAFTAYAATGSTVASLAATRDANARLMTQLADKTVTALIAATGQTR